MCLITVKGLTVNTVKIKGVEIEPCFSPYDRGKSRIITEHPIHEGEIFCIFEGPNQQVNEVHEKIRKAWFINTQLFVPQSRALTDEERIEAFSQVRQDSDLLIYEGFKWLLYKTHKDILVALKIVVRGSNDPDSRKPEKRVYPGLDFQSEDSLTHINNDLGEIIPDVKTREKIIRRLKGEFLTTVY